MTLQDRLKAIDYRYKIVLASIITFFVITIIGAIISELKTVVDIISWPLVQFFTTLHPINDTPDLFKILYAALCIIFYLTIISFPFSCISAIRHIHSDLENKKDSLGIELYTKEIAATLEVLEQFPNSQREQEEVLENFLRNISNKIIESFPLIRMSAVRYAFLISKPNTSNMEYSTVKFGRNGSLTDDDHKVIDWILTNQEEDFYINGEVKYDVPDVTVGYEMETVGLVRNSGQDFRFGFVIFFRNKDTLQNPQAVDQFIINSSAIRVFAYMDTLWNSMVEFSYTEQEEADDSGINK